MLVLLITNSSKSPLRAFTGRVLIFLSLVLAVVAIGLPYWGNCKLGEESLGHFGLFQVKSKKEDKVSANDPRINADNV